MANTLRFKRGLVSGIPTAALGEPLFTTDTFDLYIGNGTGNTRFQKYIASGATTQLLRGDGSLYTFPLAISSPSAGQVLKYNGTSWVNDSDAGITGSGVAGQVAYFTGATTQGGSNNLFWDATNNRLGIGTNTPTVPLHIIDSNPLAIGDSTGSLCISHETGSVAIGQGGGIFLSIPASGGSFFSTYIKASRETANVANSAASLIFGTRVNGGTNTQRARITSTGNFIINNASTDNGLRFQVTGDGYFSGNLGLGVTPSNSTLPTIQSTYGVLSGNTNISIVRNAHYNGGWKYTATGQATFYQQDGGSHIWYNAPSGTANNSITFTTQMLLDASGRLGIGTTSPTSLLHINTSGSAVGGVRLTSSTNTNGSAYVATNAGGDSYFGRNSSTGGAFGGAAYATVLFGGGAYPMSFYTNSVERMTLDASGNLGLGVTPSAWLAGVRAFEINSKGNSIVSSTSSQNLVTANAYFDGAWKYGSTAAASYYSQQSGVHAWFNAISGTINTAITFTQAMTLDASGRLGIGTTSPNTILHVAKDETLNAFTDYLQLSDNTNGLRFSNYFDVSGIRWDLRRGTTSIMSIWQGNNVGIGTTTNAGYKLDVNGTMRVSGESTFSSSVTATSFNLGNGQFLRLTRASGGLQYDAFGIVAGTDNTRLISTGDFDVVNGGLSSMFKIASTGAATFSSSVTAASFIPTSSTIPTNGMYLSAANTLAFATASGNKLTISSTGLATFSDSARFSNLKGCIFVQTGGSLLGSISMDSSNQVTIDNNGFFGLSVGSNYTMTGGNLGIGHSSFGTSATRTVSVVNGTAPSTSPTDAFQMYSNDVVAGNAAPHFRTENGAIIKLYQETTAVGNSTISVGGGNAVLDDTEFDGYTLRQIVRALRNQGILQ